MGCNSPDTNPYGQMASVGYTDYIYERNSWYSTQNYDTLGISIIDSQITIRDNYNSDNGDKIQNYKQIGLDSNRTEIQLIYNATTRETVILDTSKFNPMIEYEYQSNNLTDVLYIKETQLLSGKKGKV